VELTAVNYLIKGCLVQIFFAGHNFHGKYEYVPVESMQKTVDVIVK
jgi:di/tripeptidase